MTNGIERSVTPVPRHFFLWLGAAIALCAGVVEPPLLLLRRAVLDMPVDADAQLVWMAPLANLLIFLPLGAVLDLLRAGRTKWSMQSGVAALLTLALFALLAVLPRLHAGALLVFAAGVSVQLSRIVVRHHIWVTVWARRGVLIAGGVIGAAAVAIAAVPDARELWLRRSGPQPPEGALNVLLLVLDTVRWKSLGISGYPRSTSPAIDSWVRNGADFTSASVTSPWTLPSHAGMFTGLYPHELDAGFKTPLESGPPTLAETLGAFGYATAGFVANRRYGSREFGLGRGFTRYVDFRRSPAQILISSSMWRHILWHARVQDLLGYYDLYGRANAATINGELLDWIDETDRPFFAFVNYYDAHDPYLPPPPFDTRFTGQRRRGRPANLEGTLATSAIQREQDMYESTIAYLDAQIGSLRDSLAARGILDRTLVIITSDHGEQFGEHDMLGHGNSLYSPLLHVPLAIISPGAVPTGMRITEPVTLRDLPATLVRLAVGNVEHAIPGKSLSRFWDGEIRGAPHSPVLAALTWPNGQIAYALRQDSLLYIDWFQEREELYDLARDPGETTNLAPRAEWQAALRHMRAAKDSLVGHVVRRPERGM
jgi:arylsulfatase A-like enzyme